MDEEDQSHFTTMFAIAIYAMILSIIPYLSGVDYLTQLNIFFFYLGWMIGNSILRIVSNRTQEASPEAIMITFMTGTMLFVAEINENKLHIPNLLIITLFFQIAQFVQVIVIDLLKKEE